MSDPVLELVAECREDYPTPRIRRLARIVEVLYETRCTGEVTEAGVCMNDGICGPCRARAIAEENP